MACCKSAPVVRHGWTVTSGQVKRQTPWAARLPGAFSGLDPRDVKITCYLDARRPLLDAIGTRASCRIDTMCIIGELSSGTNKLNWVL